MSYTKIDRLNEGHENMLPAELLNMTVGEMLNKIEMLDTQGDAEYEIIEDALNAIHNKILKGGYEADEVNFTPDEVEVGDDQSDLEYEEEEEIPTFDQVSGDMVGNSDKSQLDDFEF